MSRRIQRALGVLRVLSVFALVILLAGFSTPTPASVSIGFVFMAAGECLRFWAAGHLIKTRELITSGPYRYTRNPLYLGRLLIFTGLAIACRLPYYGHWAVLAGGYLVFFGYYLPRKERVEPTRLRVVHGRRYEIYYRAVPALIPRSTPWRGGSPAGWHSTRMVRNREHWMVTGLLILNLLLLWRAYG